ncbi:hypothetical protein KH172YL63_04750 [Bacillus sp. KH172YL63]|nr:hypothetical protein KH172YL63_04750 [Bacillus sp. KH172YL63]
MALAQCMGGSGGTWKLGNMHQGQRHNMEIAECAWGAVAQHGNCDMRMGGSCTAWKLRNTYEGKRHNKAIALYAWGERHNMAITQYMLKVTQ